MSAQRRQFPQEWRQRAQLLATRGYTAAEIRNHLLDEGKDVPRHRIFYWVDGIAPVSARKS